MLRQIGERLIQNKHNVIITKDMPKATIDAILKTTYDAFRKDNPSYSVKTYGHSMKEWMIHLNNAVKTKDFDALTTYHKTLLKKPPATPIVRENLAVYLKQMVDVVRVPRDSVLPRPPTFTLAMKECPDMARFNALMNFDNAIKSELLDDNNIVFANCDSNSFKFRRATEEFLF